MQRAHMRMQFSSLSCLGQRLLLSMKVIDVPATASPQITSKRRISDE